MTGKEFDGEPVILNRVGCPACAEKDEEIARIKDAALGRGMVSEMADVGEVSVLVVGLHQRIVELEEKLAQARNALSVAH